MAPPVRGSAPSGQPEVLSIDDPIATDRWAYMDKKGNERIAEVAVGRPVPVDPHDPASDWYCPVRVEHFSPGVVTAMGVGPVDALLNATTLIEAFKASMVGVSPRA